MEWVKTMEEVGVRLRFLREIEDLFAESNGIQENRKLQDKGTAKPILPRIIRRMSSLVVPKLTWKKDILNHDDARTNGGDKIVESSKRIDSVDCRVRHERDMLRYLLAGCKVLANSTYLSRHNRALMIMAVAWAKEYELVGGDMVWYKKGGNEEWYWKTKEENSCGILNSIYAKPQRREDLT